MDAQLRLDGRIYVATGLHIFYGYSAHWQNCLLSPGSATTHHRC